MATTAKTVFAHFRQVLHASAQYDQAITVFHRLKKRLEVSNLCSLSWDQTVTFSDLAHGLSPPFRLAADHCAAESPCRRGDVTRRWGFMPVSKFCWKRNRCGCDFFCDKLWGFLPGSEESLIDIVKGGTQGFPRHEVSDKQEVLFEDVSPSTAFSIRRLDIGQEFSGYIKEKKRKMVFRVQSTVKRERNWSKFCWQFAMWGAWMRCVRVFVDEKNV